MHDGIGPSPARCREIRLSRKSRGVVRAESGTGNEFMCVSAHLCKSAIHQKVKESRCTVMTALLGREGFELY